MDILQRFLDRVPSTYYQHILELELSTRSTKGWPTEDYCRTDAVVSLLAGCNRLQNLTLELDGALANHVIPAFSHLPYVKQLSISNCASEEERPLYVLLLSH